MLRTGLRWVLVAAALVITGCHSDNPNVPDVNMVVSIDPLSTGTGLISTLDGQIVCPGTCTGTYDQGDRILLIATPDNGSTFTGWSGDCTGTNPQSSVKLDTDMMCVGRFDATVTVVLTITEDPTSTGTGAITGPGIDCGIDCTESYALNANVDLSVTLDPNIDFGGWGGDCAGFGLSLSVQFTMDGDKNCTVRYDDPAQSGPLQPHGTYNFGWRVEAGALKGTTFYAPAYDAGNLEGTTVDFSDLDNPTSPAGPEFSTCPGARTATIYNNPFAPYNQDVLHTICTSARSGTVTPAGGGISTSTNYGFEAGSVRLVPSTSWTLYTDFEFGQLQLFDLNPTPLTPITIPLSPLERSCPFSQVIHGDTAYVVGREGAAGTSTANCDNWRGMWFVDLTQHMVVDFLAFGTQPRNVEYGPDDMVYVTDFEEDKVYVIDPATRTIDRSFVVGDGPVGLKLTPDTRLLVTNWNTNLVKVFDLTNDQEVGSINSGGVQPVDVFLTGSTVIVLNFGDPTNNIGAALKFFTLQ